MKLTYKKQMIIAVIIIILTNIMMLWTRIAGVILVLIGVFTRVHI